MTGKFLERIGLILSRVGYYVFNFIRVILGTALICAVIYYFLCLFPLMLGDIQKKPLTIGITTLIVLAAGGLGYVIANFKKFHV